jgi:hypothetical protein
MVAYPKTNPGKLAKAQPASAATQLRIEMLEYRASIDILRHQRDRAGADPRGDPRYTPSATPS